MITIEDEWGVMVDAVYGFSSLYPLVLRSREALDRSDRMVDRLSPDASTAFPQLVLPAFIAEIEALRAFARSLDPYPQQEMDIETLCLIQELAVKCQYLMRHTIKVYPD